MSFAPPPGPPPPPVPEGWKAQFDDRYKQWFFVNLSTGVSQWEPPERPAHKDAAPPSEAPPSYEQSGPGNPVAVAAAGDKKGTLGSNNPYNQPGAGSSSVEDDARLAAQLQAEEDARAAGRSPAGASADYYNQGPTLPPRPGSQGSSMPEPQQQRSKSGGFLGKLLGKASGKHSSGYSNPGPQYGGYPPAQGGYGGYPPQQPGYGGYPGGGYAGGYPPQGYGAPPRRHGGGLGTAGAAALGVGGGLLGGALLANALDDHNDYENGYEAGFDDGADFGGDF
ncbi:hypothetical protein VTN00DRAFT_940 [Thermoascus crustaceus]|uniref:uncharacterized protein n=1 Tax=Thermoascus crustaceus TaxID=5088 RepID=UPI00374241F4